MQSIEQVIAVPIEDRPGNEGGMPAARLFAAFAISKKLIGGILFPLDERTRVQRDALLAFGVRVASAAILYLSQIVLARWMGSHDYGIYVFVWTWVLVLGGLSGLGLSGGTLRLMAEYKEKGESALALGLARGGRAIAFLTGTLVATIGLAGLWLFGDHLGSNYVLPAYLALVCIPMYAIEHVQDGIGRGSGWMAIALIPPYVLRPLLILMAMAVAHEAGLPMNATTAAAAAITAVWMTTTVQAVCVNRRLASEIGTGKRRYAFRNWFSVSLPLLAAYACELITQNADILVVSQFMTPTDVGVYFAAAKTMSLIMFVHYAVGTAVAARFSALNARGDTLGLKAFVADAANWTFWPSLAGAILILVAGKPLLALFGPDFLAGYPVMFILVLGFLFRSAMGPTEILLNMLGEQRICAVLMGATALLSVVLNLALVPRFGLNGAAAASALALVASALMSYVAARRRLGLDVAIWHNLCRS